MPATVPVLVAVLIAHQPLSVGAVSFGKSRLSDEDGLFIFFDPRAQVVWYGKKLKFQALYWTSQDTRLSEAGQRYGTVTASRGGKNVSKLDLREKFYYENETEYKKIQLTVTDSAGKKAKQICTWEGPVANGW